MLSDNIFYCQICATGFVFFKKPSSGTGITSTLYTKHYSLKRREGGVSFTDIHIHMCYIVATKHTEIKSLSFGQYIKHTCMNISKTENLAPRPAPF